MSGRTGSVLVALGLIAAVAQAQGPPVKGARDAPRVPARQVSGESVGTGTVQYDPGAPADGSFLTVFPTRYGGNRFDTRNGLPLSAGTVTQVSWYQATIFATVGYVWAGPLVGTLSTAVPVTGVAPFAFNSAAVSWPVVGSGLFAGVINSGAWGSLGLRSASTNGQGFHGMQRDWSGGVSTTLPGQNAMVRVSGSIIIPVELLEFEVE